MPELVWYRSLYWRFALGFAALLALLLAAQGFVFLWMTGQMTDLFPSRSPAQFAASLASDATTALAERPDVDLNAYLNTQHASAFRAFVVVMRDGRTVTSQRIAPPPNLTRAAFGRLNGDFGPGGQGWRPPPPGGGDPRGPRSGGPGAPARGDGPGPARGDGRGRGDRGFRPDGRGGPPGPRAEFAAITLTGVEAGIVAVPIEPPPLSAALRNLGPTLAVVAFILLATGTAGAALLVFRPANRRLRDLERAARALGAGTAGVRAPESGGDEVASLAHAFNEMAGRLEERSHALASADRTRRQLLADVSHELTTPLAAIRGYVETLGMTDLSLDDATRQRYLAIVHDETERLEHIVGDLLELARLEGGGGTLKMEPVAIASLFERLRHRHGPLLADKEIDLEAHVSPDAAVVTGDANRLEQALQNLVANAVRHTPTHGRIIVRSTSDDGRVLLSVEDSGPGIPEEHLPHVFDRFYKVDVSRTGTPLASGSGLGLSIVQAIITRHAGIVTAANAPGGGARFTIALPAPAHALPAPARP